MPPVQVSYYSDVLCVWAYVAERRIEKLVETFGDEISVDAHFCSVFPDAWGKIEQRWGERGGFEGFGKHVNEVALKFPHIEVHPRLWHDNRPRTSASAHQFIKAVEIIEREAGGDGARPAAYLERLSTRAASALRHAFFTEAKDISNWQVHTEIAANLGIDYALVEEKNHSSEAVAQLALDYDLSQKQGIAMSPTIIMNEGRQKLFGNVGYRVLEANVGELLRSAPEDEASWC